MPLEGSYAIWNNRGGTGKTTLTYHLANKYAIQNPDKTVLLIDMCPQADLSHAFLGDDGSQVDFVSQIATLKKEPMVIMEQTVPKTVSGYLDISTSINLSNANIDPRTFLFNVSKFNPQLSRNLYLLCGDPSIELVGRSLEQRRNQHASLSQFGTHAWKSVTTMLKQFIKKIAERKGIKLVAFIDLNSSFSIITEIALAAADRLLIPITDDHLHRNGFEYMFALLYGFSHPSNVYYYYRHFSFYYRAIEHDVKLPKIHLILNKVTRTFGDTLENNLDNDTVWNFIFDLFKKHPEAFNLVNKPNLVKTLKEFKELFVIDICEQVSTNQMVRQAVKSHSPLLSVKHFHHSSNNLSSNIGLNNSSSSLATSTSKPKRSPSPSIREPVLPLVSTNGGSGYIIASNSAGKRPYPLQHNQHISQPLRRFLVGGESSMPPKNESRSASNLNVNDDLNVNDLERSNALAFDRVLDKIVESLVKNG